MFHHMKPHSRLSSLLFGHYQGHDRIEGVLRFDEPRALYRIEFTRPGIYDRVSAVVAGEMAFVGEADVSGYFSRLRENMEQLARERKPYKPDADEFVFLDSQTEIDAPRNSESGVNVRILHGLRIMDAEIRHGQHVLRLEQHRDGRLGRYEDMIRERLKSKQS